MGQPAAPLRLTGNGSGGSSGGMADLTRSETRRLVLATIASRGEATQSEMLAVLNWAQRVRRAHDELRLVLDGVLLVNGFSEQGGPEYVAVVDWPEEKQQMYRAMLEQSDAARNRH